MYTQEEENPFIRSSTPSWRALSSSGLFGSFSISTVCDS